MSEIKQISLEKVSFSTEELGKMVYRLLESGFRVSAFCKDPEKVPLKGVTISIEGGIGRIEVIHGEFISTTVHRPSTKCGTGFRVDKKGVTPHELCRMKCPDWAIGFEDIIELYQDFDQYLSLNKRQTEITI